LGLRPQPVLQAPEPGHPLPLGTHAVPFRSARCCRPVRPSRSTPSPGASEN